MREIGFTYMCEKNGHKFERPYIIHYCPDCGSMFDYKTARYVPLFAYTLNNTAIKLLSEDIDIERKLTPLYTYLEEKGLDASFEAEMTGVSGSTHLFDLVAVRDDITILFDYSLGDTTKLVGLLGKKMDLPGREAILLDFSENEELVQLSKVYNIPVLRVQEDGWEKEIDLILNKEKEPQQKSAPRRSLWGRRK